MTARGWLVLVGAVALVLGLGGAARAEIAVTGRLVRCGGSPSAGTPPIDTRPGAYTMPATTGPSVPWNELAVSGPLVEPASVVRELIEPAFRKVQTASEPERTLGIADAVATYGYQLVGTETHTSAAGVTVELRLAPLPIVRKVDIAIDHRDFRQSLSTALLDEEIRRRVQVKAGSYLPWRTDARTCKLLEEKSRIEDYLHDEGYFDATAEITETGGSTDDGVPVHIAVHLQDAYDYDYTKIAILHPAGPLDISDAEIQEVFKHCSTRVIFCFGTHRFTRTQHQLDIAAVAEKFHKKGYPMVRVTSDYTLAGSFDRRTHEVRFKITIDQRRLLDVQFESPDLDANGISTEDLRAQLTFNEAASADDVEAAASARALAAYLQTRGHFDARVTWARERIAETAHSAGFDLLRFRIDLGPQRDVQDVTFSGVHALDEGDLKDLVQTKANRFTGTLFGTNAAATSAGLAADVDRVVDAYRRAGYRDARVTVSAATTPVALADAALTAALVSADHGDGLYVRFDVDEGTPTELARVELAAPGDAALCTPLLARLGDLLGDPTALHRRPITAATAGTCVADVTGQRFKEADLQRISDALRDWLWSHGRARAGVEMHWEVDSPHRVAVRYDLRRTEPLTMGKVVIRGNFRTHDSVISGRWGELKLKEGQPLTSDALAQAAQLLRATGLFDAVSVQLPNLCSTPNPTCVATTGDVNAVVVVQERYDYLAQVETSLGYSSYSGAFVTGGLSQKNLLGLGIFGEGTVTDGTKIFGVDLTARVPRWLMRRVTPFDYLQTDATLFMRNQDTPNFGQVQTKGFSTGLTYAPTPRTRTTATDPAQALVVGLHYDFRQRGRNVDALRPSGVDSDQTQVPITTDTGSVGVTLEFDRRVDRRGALSPLAPEDGFRVGASAAIASKLLLGQDEFIKLSLTGTKYWPIGDNLVVRTDLRYDQGIPLFGAVLLPEVERFFAGGDSTVRGYADDRMATEIVSVGVPPLGNVQQLRILPSGGNIRAMGSIDAQFHITSWLASAVFTDAGLITNQWNTTSTHDIRPAVGMALGRAVTPFGTLAVEYAVPILPHLGDDPRGRWHLSFAARAQF